MQGQNDWEPYHTKDHQPSDPKVEKHYIMVITLGGFGLLDYGVMRSGCRNLKQPDDVTFWFDRLVELGIGTAEDEARLRATVWKVCPSAYLHALAAAAIVVSNRSQNGC